MNANITKVLVSFLLMGMLSLSGWAVTESEVESVGTTSLSAPEQAHGVRKVTINWTSNASGTATSSIKNVYGTLVRAVYAPVAAASPSANYDITLKDEDSIDVLLGTGDNESATVAANAAIASATYPMGIPVAGHLALSVTNAGNAKRGTIKLYFIREE